MTYEEPINLDIKDVSALTLLEKVSTVLSIETIKEIYDNLISLESKRLAIKILKDKSVEGFSCLDCYDKGWYVHYYTNLTGCDAEQRQCEFCYTNPLSKFNLKNVYL